MDNPGIAFLKQMHDVKVYNLVWGKNSSLYKKAILMNPSKDQTKPISVFLGDKQISIERHYLIPEKITTNQFYFFIYVLLRDKFIPFFSALVVKNFNDLTSWQIGYFDNKRKFLKEFSENFVKIKGTQFQVEFDEILKRCKFVSFETDFTFKKVAEMTRHELIAEFELFLGKQKQLIPNDDFINGEIPSLEINTNRDPEIWLNSIELAPEGKRLFNLGRVDSIEKIGFSPELFGPEREDPLNWIGNKHIVVILNENLMTQSSIRLKKCQKISFEIRASKTITLNDCLSKWKGEN